MELRNASVKLPADLHQQIKDELEAKNITMSQFFEMAAKEHFDKEKGGKTMANGRTLAFTVSPVFRGPAEPGLPAACGEGGAPQRGADILWQAAG